MNKLLYLLLLGYIGLVAGCSHDHEGHDDHHGTHEEAEHDHEHDHEHEDAEEVYTDYTATVKAHMEAVVANDIELIMADYTEESTIITPDATVTGLENIRSFFEGIFLMFPAEGTIVNLDRVEQAYEAVYVTWHGETPALTILLGTDTFLFDDDTDKIDIQTFAAYMVPNEAPDEDETAE